MSNMRNIYFMFVVYTIFSIYHLAFVQCFIIKDQNRLKILRQKLKRDVTVIQTRAGDPCPTVVDSNRVVGFGWNVAPSVSTNLYAQGQNTNPVQGFKSWGGNLGANNVGFQLPFNVGIPIGSKVLNATNSGCTESQPQFSQPQNSFSGNQGFQPAPQPASFVQPPQPVQSVQPVQQVVQPPPDPQPVNPFSGSGLPTPPPIPGENNFNANNIGNAAAPGSRNPFDNTGIQNGNKIIVNRQQG